MRLICRSCAAAVLWSLIFTSEESQLLLVDSQKIDNSQTYVSWMNHESYYDMIWQPYKWVSYSLISWYMRRCQIRVQFKSGARTKFLAPLFQPMTSMSDYQSFPWSHSFQKMYNTHMCKRHLIVEKWGLSKKIYLNFIKNCKVLLECFTLGHFINTFMKTNYKVSYMNGFVLA